MSGHQFTIDDLRRILREAAGVDEGVDLDGDILDLEFTSLGYDSVAVLESGSRIEREFGVSLDDDLLNESRTPRILIEVVNDLLAPSSAL
ncbi:MAG TPA: acyl carrier protein [Actinocrinis sp.]|nr:acyl carrier protein [Actinocrinis sp.]